MVIFKGCVPLANDIETIEIETDSRLWDLHNACEFVGYSYSTYERKLSLDWDYYDYTLGKAVRKIQINLSKVRALHITPRDSEMPFEEDKCLEKLTYHADNSKLTFVFCGGIIIEVTSIEFYFRVMSQQS